MNKILVPALLSLCLVGCGNPDMKSYSYGSSLEGIEESLSRIACVLSRYDKEKMGHPWSYNYTCDGQSTEGFPNAH